MSAHHSSKKVRDLGGGSYRMTGSHGHRSHRSHGSRHGSRHRSRSRSRSRSPSPDSHRRGHRSYGRSTDLSLGGLSLSQLKEEKYVPDIVCDDDSSTCMDLNYANKPISATSVLGSRGWPVNANKEGSFNCPVLYMRKEFGQQLAMEFHLAKKKGDWDDFALSNWDLRMRFAFDPKDPNKSVSLEDYQNALKAGFVDWFVAPPAPVTAPVTVPSAPATAPVTAPAAPPMDPNESININKALGELSNQFAALGLDICALLPAKIHLLRMKEDAKNKLTNHPSMFVLGSDTIVFAGDKIELSTLQGYLLRAIYMIILRHNKLGVRNKLFAQFGWIPVDRHVSISSEMEQTRARGFEGIGPGLYKHIDEKDRSMATVTVCVYGSKAPVAPEAATIVPMKPGDKVGNRRTYKAEVTPGYNLYAVPLDFEISKKALGPSPDLKVVNLPQERSLAVFNTIITKFTNVSSLIGMDDKQKLCWKILQSPLSKF